MGIAIQAWNLMGGIEWDAIPYMVERFGIDDVDAFVTQLVAIRDHQNKVQSAQQ